MKYNEVVVNISWLLLFIGFVQAQQPVSLNIDCGETSSYFEAKIGSEYVPDNEFIESGKIYNVSSILNDTSYLRTTWNLRSFPSDKRNCYRLKSVTGSTYLIRVTSLYGNYDNLNSPPKFDFYIGSDYWTTTDLAQYPNGVYSELITVATSDLLFICLINTGKGIPIISEIRLVTLPNHLYGNLTSSGSLILYVRSNVGSNETVRYPDDIYDRIWEDWNKYDSINTTNNIIYSKVPSKVLQTASVPEGNDDSIFWWWSALQYSADLYHIVLHFAELEKLKKNESRKFNIYHKENLLYGPLQPKYLNVTTIYNPAPLEGKDLTFYINKTTNSTHPPLLNAMELFLVMKFNGSTTDRQDVEAIMGVKEAYQVKKNWMGDPCLPKDFPWSGLTCDNHDPPRITALNLSNSGLMGSISDYLSKMSSIENIDLSNNNLTGSIPEFLAQLTSLKVINLSNNKLSGYIPNSLKERITNGLQIIIDNNSTDENHPTILTPSPTSPVDENHPKKSVPLLIIVPVIIAAFIVLGILAILCIYKRKGRKSLPLQERNTTYRDLVKHGSEIKKYSYKEVLKITNNFENIIGKGGYGTVFSGHLDDGKKVAVKVLSESSAQGFKEFSTEINLLTKIHHKNLVSFVGYCNNDTEKVLLYEYMERGNLHNFLSSDSNVKLNAFSWEQRIRIALDAAQGLEYLHHGCQPPIVHRDVKMTNILLNERLQAKIADFGLSKTYSLDGVSHISTDVKGTPGYIDPEYYILNKLNEKSDVYSFGVVLLELLTGEPPLIRASEGTHIVQRVNSILQKGEIRKVIDSRLEGELDIQSVWKFAEIALKCTSPSSTQRPSMSQVVIDLKECLKQETPNYRFDNEIESNIPSIQSLDTQPLAR